MILYYAHNKIVYFRNWWLCGLDFMMRLLQINKIATLRKIFHCIILPGEQYN